jgi:hypothetical protein
MSSLGKELNLFYELRANISPHELLALREAGLSAVQLGIEALSNSVLDRIGKGTTVIQNLQAMRTCRELGIENRANLIVEFPGCTEADVAETRENILRYALLYEPLNTSSFNLGVESTVDSLREDFGVTNVRNADAARVGLPDEVHRRLKLCDLSFDDPSRVSWDPVREACETWRSKQNAVGGRALLSYQDGGSFLRIEDRRDYLEILTIERLYREVYLACMEARTIEQVLRDLGREVKRIEVEEILKELVAASLTYEERGRYLSLAIATRPELAAKRMRRYSGARLSPS